MKRDIPLDGVKRTAIVDLLIQRENDIFPVEVKSEANTTSKSLKKFKELFSDRVKLRVQFSPDNLKLDDDVLTGKVHD